MPELGSHDLRWRECPDLADGEPRVWDVGSIEVSAAGQTIAIEVPDFGRTEDP